MRTLSSQEKRKSRMTEDENNRAPNMDTKAVAIKRESEAATPRITAKGHGYVAEDILNIAFAEGVKVRQDKDLTELLDAFEVESPVPLEALHTVSLILERVYAENKKMEKDTTNHRNESNTDAFSPDSSSQ